MYIKFHFRSEFIVYEGVVLLNNTPLYLFFVQTMTIFRWFFGSINHIRRFFFPSVFSPLTEQFFIQQVLVQHSHSQHPPEQVQHSHAPSTAPARIWWALRWSSISVTLGNWSFSSVWSDIIVITLCTVFSVILFLLLPKLIPLIFFRIIRIIFTLLSTKAFTLPLKYMPD